MGVGVAMYSADLKHVEQTQNKLFVSPYSTNIYAEMLGIELALQMCVEANNPETRWIIWCDLGYAVECFNDPSLARKPHLVAVMKRIQKLYDRLKWRVEVRWIPREQNTEADELSKAVFAQEGVDRFDAELFDE